MYIGNPPAAASQWLLEWAVHRPLPPGAVRCWHSQSPRCSLVQRIPGMGHWDSHTGARNIAVCTAGHDTQTGSWEEILYTVEYNRAIQDHSNFIALQSSCNLVHHDSWTVTRVNSYSLFYHDLDICFYDSLSLEQLRNTTITI